MSRNSTLFHNFPSFWYGLIGCNEKVENIISDLTVQSIDVRILFLFSHANEYSEKKRNILAEGYNYIYEESKLNDVPVKYARSFWNRKSGKEI